MTAQTYPKPPANLAVDGRRFWHTVTADLELSTSELVLLECVCQTLDIIARLEPAVDEAPLTVTGSQGQEVIHPLVPELRAQRAALVALLKHLALPDVDDGVQTASSSARALARSRWGAKPR